MAEFQVHGSLAVLEKLSQVLSQQGFRLAEPGEFARRALDRGKMDLLDTEALDLLVQAEDQVALRLAQQQADPARQQLLEGWRAKLTQLQAASEALIDFPEDDLPETLIARNQHDLEDLIHEVRALLHRSSLAQTLASGLQVLLVGPPNAGKSTLLNALAGYERAIVTEIPGTTRDFVELDLRLGAFKVTFVDTAGLRETGDEVERVGVERTRARFSKASLILSLHGPDQVPETIEASSPVWTIQTKGQVEGRRSLAAGEPDQAGVDELLVEIQEYFRETYAPLESNLAFQRDRQVFHVKHLLEALEAAQQDQDLPEVQAENLRRAAQALAYLTGRIHVEEVLDALFSGFCIGK